MRKDKGFTPIIALLVILLVIGGIYLGLMRVRQNQTVNPVYSPSPTVDTTNWKIYDNKEFGFSFKYPQDLSVGNIHNGGPNKNVAFGLELDKQTNIASYTFTVYKSTLVSIDNWLKENGPTLREGVDTMDSYVLQNVGIVYRIRRPALPPQGKNVSLVDTMFVFFDSGKSKAYLLQSLSFGKGTEDVASQILSTFKFIK